jgi:hypothetical protein
MFNSIIVRSITAIVAAALAAGLVVFLTSVVPEASAESQVMDAVHQPHGKADRLPGFVKGTARSSRGWPHYERSCQFDLRRPANEAPSVRVIALR